MSQHPTALQKSTSVVEKGKTSIKVTPGAVIALDCELRGDITIGSRTIIHPKARIIAEAGPIIIGEFNLIEEQSSILHLVDDTCDTQKQSVMIIGNFNVFEVSSKCEALNVGDHNVIECKAEVGRNVELSNGCIIGCKCHVNCVERLPENTVIYGSNCDRRVQMEKPQPQTLQIDFLAKIMPNYMRMRKLNKAQKPSPQ